jgi:tetratricopeptide (TPR) repeat protein
MAVALGLLSLPHLNFWSGDGRSAEAQTQMDVAQLLYKEKRLVEARAAFQKAADLAPNDAQPCNWLTKIAIESNMPDAALQSIDESLKRNPIDSDVWRTAGDLYHQLGNNRSAQSAYRQATTANAKDAAAWKSLGILEMSIDSTASVRDLGQAAALSPDDFETQLALGRAATNTGNVAIAEPALRKALALRPSDPDAQLASANLLVIADASTETLKRAGDLIDSAILRNPSPAAYLLRGRLRLLQRRYPAAITDLTEALRRDPKLPAAHVYLSQSYAATHQTALARREADTFVRLSGSQQQARDTHQSGNP